MGLVLPQRKLIKWATTSKEHYIKLGYTYTNIGDLFEVDVRDLSKGSTNLVDLNCDFCGSIHHRPYKAYLKLQSDKYCCPKCLSHKKKTRDNDGNLLFIEIPYRNKEWLYSEYIEKDRKSEDIANECGINVRTLKEWISFFELNNKGKKDVSFIKQEELIDLYVTQMKNSLEVGAIYGVSDYIIRRLLREYSIKIPNRKELVSRYLYKKGGLEKFREYGNNKENRIKASCRIRKIKRSDFIDFASSENKRIRNSSEYREWRIMCLLDMITLVNVAANVAEIYKRIT